MSSKNKICSPIKKSNARWKRWKPDPYIKSCLIDYYENVNKFPKKDEVETLSKKYDIPDRNVKVFFQNRRQRSFERFDNTIDSNKSDIISNYFKEQEQKQFNNEFLELEAINIELFSFIQEFNNFNQRFQQIIIQGQTNIQQAQLTIEKDKELFEQEFNYKKLEQQLLLLKNKLKETDKMSKDNYNNNNNNNSTINETNQTDKKIFDNLLKTNSNEKILYDNLYELYEENVMLKQLNIDNIDNTAIIFRLLNLERFELENIYIMSIAFKKCFNSNYDSLTNIYLSYIYFDTMKYSTEKINKIITYLWYLIVNTA